MCHDNNQIMNQAVLHENMHEASRLPCANNMLHSAEFTDAKYRIIAV